MKQLLTAIFLFITLQAFSQKIEKYYDYNWKECIPKNARFYSLITKIDSGWHRYDYYLNLKTLHMGGTYEDEDCKVKIGRFNYYYPNRQLQYSGNYVHDIKEGLWLSYHYNGIMSDSSFYVNGKKVGTSIGWYQNGYIPTRLR
jgi:hypothetical protein